MNPSLDQLATMVRGHVISPGSEEYDKARGVYNAMHDKHPAAVVRIDGVDDVVACVNFARENDLLLAIRGGSHSVAGFGTCDDGLVIDLCAMNRVTVNTINNQVTAEGGSTLGDLDKATHVHGLAVPGGTVSTTGLAGLTLGGGMGHLSRSCGLSCDNLVSAQVVTASGDVLTCDESNNPDLFWAIRGGGGNFGVVTSFTFKAYPVETVFGGPTMFRIDADVIHHYQSLVSSLPEAYNAIFAFALAPPAPFVPEEWHGKPVMIILSCWSGAESEDERILEAVSAKGDIVGQALWRMPYPEINTFFDELLPSGLRHYWKANAFMEFTEVVIEQHLEHGPRVGNMESGIFIFSINGACHAVDDNDSAFASRQANFSSAIAGTWHDAADDEKYIKWVRDYFNALQPFSESGAYVNFMSEDDQDFASGSYGPKLKRLREIKKVYDPDNLFRVNQNIAP